MQAQICRTRWETIEDAVKHACTQGDFLSAETILRFAAQEYDQLGEPDYRLADSLDSLLRTCFEDKRYEQAERIYWLSLKVKENVLGRNDPDWLGNLDN
jgi:hypothetical protein